MKIVPPWVDKDLYPFQSHWMKVDGNQLHFVDEGKGEPLLFVHGTPEWSFGFRDLIKNLRTHFRCIAVDLLGFGLSDKPEVADYSCAAHAMRLGKFIDQLGLKQMNIIANDFGGSISLNYVIHYPENVKSVILFNTWMRSLKDDKHYAGPAKLINSWFGKFLYLSLNAPVNTIMPAAYGDKKKLTEKVHAHYKNALPKGQRQAAYAFALEMTHANSWWQDLWSRLDSVESKHFLFFWGLKDKFVPPSELEYWKAKLPRAEFITYEDAGHFVQEEKPEEMSKKIKEFLKEG